MTHPHVSAVVVTYRTGPRLKECLNALSADPEIAEIVIVDNGNPETDEVWLNRFAARTEKAQLMRSGENLGFGKAANAGARMAAGPLLLFINPDALLRWRSASAMSAAGAGLPAPWIIGGRIFNVDGAEERGCRRRMLTPLRALLSPPGLMQWTLEKTPPPAGPVPMDAISGALFMMPREQFLGMDGGFDEAYFLHVEDIDLCRRVWDAGGQVVYQPAAGALHFGATSDASSLFVERHKAAGLKYYFRKFARGSLGRSGAWIAGALTGLALVLRARLRPAESPRRD